MNPLLILIALYLFVAPWPTAEAHLLEKITWLQTGHPMKVIDWFDILMHGAIPPAIIGYTVFNFLKGRKEKAKISEESET